MHTWPSQGRDIHIIHIHGYYRKSSQTNENSHTHRHIRLSRDNVRKYLQMILQWKTMLTISAYRFQIFRHHMTALCQAKIHIKLTYNIVYSVHNNINKANINIIFVYNKQYWYLWMMSKWCFWYIWLNCFFNGDEVIEWVLKSLCWGCSVTQ